MKKIILLSLFVLSSAVLFGTHLRGGHISVERINCTSRTYKITVTVFTNTESTVLFGGSEDILDFGDGTRVLVPETPNTPYPGGGSYGIASQSFLHTFPGAGKYTISYVEPNRNAGLLNMSNSVGTTFYLETQIDASVCGNSPVLLVAPVDRACVGVAYYHNPGAYDLDGDSLSYEIVVPFRDRNSPVTDYKMPNDPSFYKDFSIGNETADGQPTFLIQQDGTIIWNAPSLPNGIITGSYSIAFVVKEWRKIDGIWRMIGYVRRDMEIFVEPCSYKRPELTSPDDICVEAGTTINETIFGNDPDLNRVKIEVFSEIRSSDFFSPAIIQPDPALFQSSPAETTFEWNTAIEHVMGQPYSVIFKIRNEVPFGSSLSNFKTWRIKVVGVAPVIQQVNLNELTRFTTLTWDEYSSNAQNIQVWRKVGDSDIENNDCASGLTSTSGFELIATISVKDQQGSPITSFIDTNNGKGLAVGAKYCYRLVADFPMPRGGKSYPSQSFCLAPVLANAPVITNVTVDKTGATNGQIRIQWTPPFEINTNEFPEPYEYVVQRNEGDGFVNASSKTSEITFMDVNLNTQDNPYSYRVLLYSSASTSPIDTSATASSVWLDLSTTNAMNLKWNATVPWSNQIESGPMHEIYRGAEGAAESELVFIDEVNSLQENLRYTDNDEDIIVNQKYCYRVMTRGGYANPQISEPLINYSQMKCGSFVIVGEEEDETHAVIQIYPNPTNRFVKILFSDNEEYEILLFDQFGRVQLKQLATLTAKLDLGALNNGQYLCVIKSNNQQRKIIRIIKN